MAQTAAAFLESSTNRSIRGIRGDAPELAQHVSRQVVGSRRKSQTGANSRGRRDSNAEIPQVKLTESQNWTAKRNSEGKKMQISGTECIDRDTEADALQTHHLPASVRHWAKITTSCTPQAEGHRNSRCSRPPDRGRKNHADIMANLKNCVTVDDERHMFKAAKLHDMQCSSTATSVHGKPPNSLPAGNTEKLGVCFQPA